MFNATLAKCLLLAIGVNNCYVLRTFYISTCKFFFCNQYNAEMCFTNKDALLILSTTFNGEHFFLFVKKRMFSYVINDFRQTVMTMIISVLYNNT